MNFYLTKNNQKLGPYSAEQLRIFLQQGLVTTNDLVWADGWPSWMPICNVPGLSGVTSATPSASQAQSSVPSTPSGSEKPGYPYATAKNPVVACVLSLVIVGTGQFYNGDWAKGWFMLITCIVATIFSAGAMWLFWALFSAFDAYRVASRQKPLGQYYPL